MFRKNYIVKINLPGGIVATGDLFAIVEAAERAKVTDMQFGARQQLFCKVSDKYATGLLAELEKAGIFFETGKGAYPNIVSSYVTEGVFGKSPWVSEGLYKDILEGFDFRPRLKINLVESGQSFVPFFTGHLNFVSSTLNNHWHLVIRRPGTDELYSWPSVVYSPDIPRVSRSIEIHGPFCDWGLRLYETVRSAESLSWQPPPALRLPAFRLPYYEGFNSYGSSKYWLGVYRREELFPLAFLRDICLIGLQTKIGQLYTTPWKSLLIKGIEEQDLPLWEYALGRHRMNIRHASNELNWQLEDFSAEGLRLKRYLVRQLDQEDIRTDGLAFSIKIQRGSGLSGSIIIRKQEEIRPGQLKLLDRYELWHTPDFDPHAKAFVLFRKDLEKENLFPYILSLCKEFYKLQSSRNPIAVEEGVAYRGREAKEDPAEIFECSDCLTQYAAAYGDPAAGVAAGTTFGQLDEGYSCPVCGSPKSEFRQMGKFGRLS